MKHINQNRQGQRWTEELKAVLRRHSLLFREILRSNVCQLERSPLPPGRTEVNLCPFALGVTSLDLKQSVESHQLPDYIFCCSRTRNTPYMPYASRSLCTICWCSVKVQIPLSLTVSMSLMTAVRWHAEVTMTMWNKAARLTHCCSSTHTYN